MCVLYVGGFQAYKTLQVTYAVLIISPTRKGASCDARWAERKLIDLPFLPPAALENRASRASKRKESRQRKEKRDSNNVHYVHCVGSYNYYSCMRSFQSLPSFHSVIMWYLLIYIIFISLLLFLFIYFSFFFLSIANEVSDCKKKEKSRTHRAATALPLCSARTWGIHRVGWLPIGCLLAPG